MKKIFLLLAAATVLNACQKELPFDDPGTESQIAVYGLLTTDERVRIRLTRSISVLENLYEEELGLSDATPFFTSNGTTIPLTHTDDGWYESTEELSDLGEIAMSVTHPTLAEVEAESTIPSAASFSSIDLVSAQDNGQTTLRIRLSDPSDEKDYFHFILTEGNPDLQPSFASFFISSSQLLEGGQSDGSLEGSSSYYQGALFTDEQFVGGEISFDIEAFQFNPETTRAQLIRCSRDYYEHVRTRLISGSSDGLFSQPVQVYENVEGGHGVLGGYSVTDVAIPF